LSSARPTFGLVAFAVAVAACMANAQPAPDWRYDLLPGDHLIYRYSLERSTQGKDQGNETVRLEARFQTHVLAVGATAGNIAIGFQRNRESAELTEYRSNGKDRLAREQIDFQKRMQKRPSRFSEAMEISATGEPHYAWEIARESSIRFVDAFHEVMILPPASLSKGESWHSNTLPGVDFRWVDDESIHGKLCHHVEGVLAGGSLKLSYWWSPELGVLEQVVVEENYSDFDENIHLTARMEIESKLRGEPIEKWLASPDTREGALQAILLTPTASITAEQLSPVLASDDPASQSLALAIASRRNIALTSNILGKLQQSNSDLVKLLAHSPSDSVAKASSPRTDECHRALPDKPRPAKFGTALQIAPPTKEIPEIPYLLRVPLTYREDRPSPLLVYLSGGAGFAMDAVSSAQDAVAGTDYLVLYPQAAGYWWKPDVARRFDAVLTDVLQRYNVDRDRVYITGFSNGGTGALYYASLWPQRFAAVVTLMGAGQCNEQIKAGLANVRSIPLLLVHGENDPIITPDCSTTTHAALVDLNPVIKPELKILPNHAHDITLQSDDGLTLTFFKDKLRNPFPRTVDLRQSDALASRAYWVEILDGKAGKSDIDARVKPDNVIEIHSHDVKSIRLHLRPELLPKSGDFRIVWNGKKIFSGPLRDVCSLPSPPTSGDPKLDLGDTRDLLLP
jgi:pimeloyl-ACP methyl ester carboxylesterase